MEPLRVFVGYDQRQPVAYHVLCHSIMESASVPVSITPLILHQLPIDRNGLTDFTYSRYLVPYLCDYVGKAVFLDSDMLVLHDIADLFNAAGNDAVSVVPFMGKFKFERPSVMVFNNDKCEVLTPKFINDVMNPVSDLAWAESVGSLPMEWNFLVGYSTPEREKPKLLHFTQGIPLYKECRDCYGADEWFADFQDMQDCCSWLELMGGSVHMQPVLNRLGFK